MSDHGTPERAPVPADAWAADPAPYAWLDDDRRMAGSTPIWVNLALAAVLLAAALALAVVTIQQHQWPGFGFVAAFALLGGYVLRMGLRRRSWRRRHPGVDPVSASPTWAGGGPIAAPTTSGAVWRWVILAVCLVLGVMAIGLGLASIFVRTAGYSLGSRLLVLALGLLFGWLLVVVISRPLWRAVREPRPADRALGIGPSAFGGLSRFATVVRVVLLVGSVAAAGLLTLAVIGEVQAPGITVVDRVGTWALVAAVALVIVFDLRRIIWLRRFRRGPLSPTTPL